MIFPMTPPQLASQLRVTMKVHPSLQVRSHAFLVPGNAPVVDQILPHSHFNLATLATSSALIVLSVARPRKDITNLYSTEDRKHSVFGPQFVLLRRSSA